MIPSVGAPPRAVVNSYDSIDLRKREARFRPVGTCVGTGEDVMRATDADVYYDPYDFEIDTDPYPIWKRLRDEAPLYYNDRYDFYAVSRFEDVERVSVDWETYSSARGTLLELIKSDFDIPPGSIIFEDPPAHDLHRAH